MDGSLCRALLSVHHVAFRVSHVYVCVSLFTGSDQGIGDVGRRRKGEGEDIWEAEGVCGRPGENGVSGRPSSILTDVLIITGLSIGTGPMA